MKKESGKIHIPYASRLEMVLCITLGCINIGLLAILCTYANIDNVILAVAVAVVYLAEITLIAVRHKYDIKIKPEKSIYELLDEQGSIVFKNSTSPVIGFDRLGVILWYNEAMREVIDSYDNYVGRNLTALFGDDFKLSEDGENVIKMRESVFSLEGFVVSEKGNGLYLAVLQDITELKETQRKYLDERVAVAYIAVDNVEEVLQYVHEKFTDEISRIDDILKNWAASMNAIIKSYDKDRYIMLFDSSYLDACIKNRFAILNEIRDARVADGVSITVSMGISRRFGSLAERELDARDAVDMALQRGGDQAVYKHEGGTEFFGGITKTVYKRANIQSRTFASQLNSLMARSENVIIMGHRYGDFDSFGAAIGVARLAMLCGIDAHIAVDLRDKNLRPCIELMQKTAKYSQSFVDNAEGLDLIGPDTLVVLVDHGTFARAQFSNIASKASAVAIIDHHRQTEDARETVKLSYIEPSASSTCELVTEMLESAISSKSLMKEEADLLLAGILLDTKQFTRNTGTRTFGAAQYLRGAGADPTDVYSLFKTVPEDLSKEARFHTGITVYRDNIAISCCEGETDDTYRVIASKAADKMLTLKGVDAAFTLVRIGEQIHISGRSQGKVNVQLILEKLHGGGHFDVAGAQVASENILAVLEELKDSIDEYLDKTVKGEA